MDAKLKQDFLERWEKYFPGADLPITFFYSDEPADAEAMPEAAPPPAHRCVIADLARPRKGKSIYLETSTIGCGGGNRYFGFVHELREGFEYFLSYGIPGKMEGERYKKSPELVKELLKAMPDFEAPAKYIVFKRWDDLSDKDEPEGVIFFAKPDVLSGLFTLAGFDEAERNAVITPFGAGCGTIVQWPYLENQSEKPRCVIGMFDVSARPYVPKEVLTFTAPMKKFERMVANMDESFLKTGSWEKVRKRI
ncbi:MAG: hypothetical protein E3J72_16945 [Planctomycetota bacterium]|nr:MAG: hypothetical protein E3J72_16945 [Planctomycetota bacterium]